MKRLIAAALTFALVAPVAAEPRKIQVLVSEGRIEVATRNRIDAAIFKLAKTTDASVAPGDITMTDAAAAVGCKVESAACKDEILGMLGVDELVYATVTPKPGGTEVVAYRIARGGVMREAKALIQTGGSPDKIDGIAPLFFATTTAQLPTTTSEPPVTPPTTTQPEPAGPVTLETTTTTTTTKIAPQPEPPQYVDEPAPSRQKLFLAGAITGGAFVLIGVLCWGKASDLQSQIDDAPTATEADLSAIRAMERDGDSYAGWGNALFLGGAVIGGISAYYLIKQRRAASAATARITPALFDRGAGIAITGGLP